MAAVAIARIVHKCVFITRYKEQVTFLIAASWSSHGVIQMKHGSEETVFRITNGGASAVPSPIFWDDTAVISGFNHRLDLLVFLVH